MELRHYLKETKKVHLLKKLRTIDPRDFKRPVSLLSIHKHLIRVRMPNFRRRSVSLSDWLKSVSGIKNFQVLFTSFKYVRTLKLAIFLVKEFYFLNKLKTKNKCGLNLYYLNEVVIHNSFDNSIRKFPPPSRKSSMKCLSQGPHRMARVGYQPLNHAADIKWRK